MKRIQGLLVSGLSILLGFGCCAWFLLQPIQISVDGHTLSIRSWQPTVGGILTDAGVAIYSGDQVTPDPDSTLLTAGDIHIRRNMAYNLLVDGRLVTTYSTSPLPANVLGTLGLKIFPGDELLADGLAITAGTALPDHPIHTIQLNRAHAVTIQGQPFSTTRWTAAEVFWQSGLASEGVRLNMADLSANIQAGGDLPVAPPVQFQTASASFTSLGGNAGSAVSRLGLAPQGLDQTNADLSAVSLAEYQVSRVVEQLDMNPKSLPYASKTTLDDSLPLDQKTVTQSGAYGLSMQLTRIRLMDGEQIDKQVESETILKPPVDEITGYGTKVQVQTMDVGGQTISYYRSLSLYATSYSPCRSGGTGCHSSTASGEPARKGIVAVLPRWYYAMVGAQLYIPGYGFAEIGDMGGGIPGTPWIDLGYNDDDFVEWSSWVTVYFLTPVPSDILYDLN